MGGFGSGGHNKGCGWRPKAEDYNRIDVRRLKREGKLECGVSGNLFFNDGTRVFYTYGIGDFTLELNGLRQKVQLSYMPVHNAHSFRVFCLCPTCAKRVAIIYICVDKFQCANCLNVTWTVCNEEPREQKIRKARKLNAKLLDSISASPVTGKTKRLYKPTFDNLTKNLDALSKLEDEIFGIAKKRFSKWI